MSDLKIITVVNDFETFNRCIKNNENLKDFEVICYDNTIENIGIPERYNTFISSIKENDDYWVAFIHQDFIFNENPLEKLTKLSKECVYGPVGINRQLIFFRYKPKFIFKIYRRCMLGRIYQGEGSYMIGAKVDDNPKVKTIDCCCCFIHSSLIYKHKLKFDENLKFHMYVEEMCYLAKKLRIDTKIIQLDCRHISEGNINDELRESALYLKKKYKLFRISSTCYK